MMSAYAELHCHSVYSFQEGASFPHELLLRAKELGLPAVALTDHDSLTGAIEFGHTAKSLGIKPITGAEVTLTDRKHLTLIAATQQGYRNLCRLLSYGHIRGDRRTPAIDPEWLKEMSGGIIALSGCSRGPAASLLEAGKHDAARESLRQYADWFDGNFYVELQNNLVYDDPERNRALYRLSKELGLPAVATNNVHYHERERHRLNDAMVAIRHLENLEDSYIERRPNSEYHLKSAQQMGELFSGYPELIANTVTIADRCGFDITRDLGYRFPEQDVPRGFTSLSYLRHVCEQAASRKYGRITRQIRDRLDEELRRIAKHDLAGFFLLYYDIIRLARDVAIKLGYGDVETPLERKPPGRGRGSSVAMMTGYLIGLSHIDPSKHDLGLDRFLPEDLASAPDIDLDFPRDIREELILQIHKQYGWERASLVGAIATYQAPGVIRDLGKVLSLPPQQLRQLSKHLDDNNARNIGLSMKGMPGFRDLVDAPGWRHLVELGQQMADMPRAVQQHSGGMVISSSPVAQIVPVMPGAIDGRFVMQWDKDAVDQVGMVKIDLLALGALSQMQEAERLVGKRTGKLIDLSQIDFNDSAIYDMIEQADTIGIFQVESAAQMQTSPRLRPRNLDDMALEVAAVRPGVGANDGVTHFINRRLGIEPVTYDHPLEEPALKRTLGVILYQDQVIELAMHVAGFTAREGDLLRRAFGRKNNTRLLEEYWAKFRDGAAERGVPECTAKVIFAKFNGGYQFPEAHAYAFAATAVQMAYLRLYHPLEFYVGLINEQPMGFWGIDTIKQDALRHGVKFLHPDVNRSSDRAVPEGDSLRLGLLSVKNIGAETTNAILQTRSHGHFLSLSDFMSRAALQREELDSLAAAGGFDCFGNSRRDTLWEIGLRYRLLGAQLPLEFPTAQDMAVLPEQNKWDRLIEEFKMLGLTPDRHLMEELRPILGGVFLRSTQLPGVPEGNHVLVAGKVERLQHPAAEAYFITLEDEEGQIPLILWPSVYEQFRQKTRETFLLVYGTVSRKQGTLNIIVKRIGTIQDFYRKHQQIGSHGIEHLPKARPLFQ